MSAQTPTSPPESPAINALLPPYNYISRFYPFPKIAQPWVQQIQGFYCPDRAELLMQPALGVYPCPWHKTDLGQTIQDCLQIIPLQLSALHSCISPEMVKLSINPSLEYLYSLSDTHTRVLELTRLHLTRRSLFISTALDPEPLPAAPAHAPDMSQTCSLPAGHGGCGDGEGRRRRDMHTCIFSNSAFHTPLVLWHDLEGDCTALCSGPSAVIPPSGAGRTLCSPASTNTSLTPSLSLSPAPSNYTTPAIIGCPILL